MRISPDFPKIVPVGLEPNTYKKPHTLPFYNIRLLKRLATELAKDGKRLPQLHLNLIQPKEAKSTKKYLYINIHVHFQMNSIQVRSLPRLNPAKYNAILFLFWRQITDECIAIFF